MTYARLSVYCPHSPYSSMLHISELLSGSSHFDQPFPSVLSEGNSIVLTSYLLLATLTTYTQRTSGYSHALVFNMSVSCSFSFPSFYNSWRRRVENAQREGTFVLGSYGLVSTSSLPLGFTSNESGTLFFVLGISIGDV
jgi:hypothetical protein